MISRTTFLLCFVLYLPLLCMTCSSTGASALTARTASICTSPPRGDCSFYQVCIESRYNCGPSGYPIGYGRTYCHAFAESEDKFTPRAQKWILDTMQCLQRALVPVAEGVSSITTCTELDDYALSTHPKCYIDNGFCTLSPSDWAEVIRIVGLKTMLGSWDVIKAEAKTAEGCGALFLFLLSNGL